MYLRHLDVILWTLLCFKVTTCVGYTIAYQKSGINFDEKMIDGDIVYVLFTDLIMIVKSLVKRV